MQAVEAFLEKNPFEAEAMEGLQQLSKADLEKHLGELEQRIEAKVKTSAHGFWTNTRRIAAATTIILAAALTLFLQRPSVDTKEITQETSQKETPSAESKAKSALDSLTQTEPEQDTVQANPGFDSENLVATRQPEQADKTQTVTKDDLVTQIKSEKPLAAAEQSEVIIETDFQALENAIAEEAEEEVVEDLENPAFQAQAAPLPDTVMNDLERAFQARLARSRVDSAQRANEALKSRLQQTERGLSVSRFLNANSPKSSITVTGKVTGGDDGLGIPRANITIKGTTQGMAADLEGNYKIELDSSLNSVLQFSFIGYVTQEITVGEQRNINVILQPDYADLDEVLVVGYGSENNVKKKEIIYQASPTDGFTAFRKYLQENFQHPSGVKKKKGKITVEFTVRANGELSDFIILKGLGEAWDQEAIRLIKEGPDWFPQMVNGNRNTSRVKFRVKVPR